MYLFTIMQMQVYAPPLPKSVACVPPQKLSIHYFSNLALSYMWMCVRMQMFAYWYAFVFMFECVRAFNVCLRDWLTDWLGANVEVETAFGFGALLQREKK